MFVWREGSFVAGVPLARAVFEEVGRNSDSGLVGIADILDGATQDLGRLSPEIFTDNQDTREVVQRFYEPFLRYYDPLLQKKLGVWYTPQEIVEYMVERTDRLLRQELGILDGLADGDVRVVDPCCGTGAYLVEVLKKIYATLAAKKGHVLAAQETLEAAKTRISGFEVMPIPYVVAQWQISEFLRSVGVTFDQTKGEQSLVCLADTLEEWQPSLSDADHQNQLGLFEANHNTKTSETQTDNQHTLVIIGNPPYNVSTDATPKNKTSHIAAYKQDLKSKWDVNKSNLNDLYIQFWGAAETQINQNGKGIVSFITNHSWCNTDRFRSCGNGC